VCVSIKKTNQRKILQKTQKDHTILKPIKRILNPKYKLCGGFTFSWPWESNRPSSLPSIAPLQQTLYNTVCLKSSLQLTNFNASNLLSGKRHLSGLNIRPAMLKIRLLVISKLLTIFSECGLRLSASIHSIVQLLIWNEIKSDASIAGHLSIGPIVNNG